MGLVEVAIVTVLILPLLMALGAASKAVVGSFDASTRAAEATELLTGTTTQTAPSLRCGLALTMRAQAEAEDVAAGRATAVGEWIWMPQREGRRSIELQSASGQTGPALVIPTTTYRALFSLDPSEVDNGVDDDGDGMVDEGELAFSRGADRVRSIKGVESCSFELDDRMLRYAVRIAKKGPSGELRRVTFEQSVFLRNL